MKKWIISLVLMRVMPVLDANGEKQLSIQNEVNIITHDDQKEAYAKCVELAKLRHPEHHVQLRVIIDMDEADAETIN